jgi:hypothetical protein
LGIIVGIKYPGLLKKLIFNPAERNAETNCANFEYNCGTLIAYGVYQITTLDKGF